VLVFSGVVAGIRFVTGWSVYQVYHSCLPKFLILYALVFRVATQKLTIRVGNCHPKHLGMLTGKQ